MVGKINYADGNLRILILSQRTGAFTLAERIRGQAVMDMHFA